MGYYKVLSKPISSLVSPKYKGLYRCEPFPPKNADDIFISLWERYTQYLEPLTYMGITNELTINELRCFAELASQATGDEYEVIYFNQTLECPQSSICYGLDVTGLGGYSILGEGGFKYSKSKFHHIFEALNENFERKINQNVLFNSLKDASDFCAVLNELEIMIPGIIESEKWQINYIFRVI